MSAAREVLDRFFSRRLGVELADLKPGQMGVATCDRRTYVERGFGFIRFLWVVHLGDRAAVSVHPTALSDVARLAWGRSPDEVMGDEFACEATAALERALPGVEPLTRGEGSVILYHPGEVAPVACDGLTRVLKREDADCWRGPRDYMKAAHHPSADIGEAFGVFLDDQMIASIITYEPPVADFAQAVAEDGIEVAQDYRGRGYGSALLAAWTREMQTRGRVRFHSPSLSNLASRGVARAVGYHEYARSRSPSHSPPEPTPDGDL